MRFPYTPAEDSSTSLMPRLLITLINNSRSIQVDGLIDSGSAVNILPYHAGIELGAVLNEQTTTIPLVGSLGHFEARALVLLASHEQLTFDTPVRLAFAWTQAEDVPLIFGQMNFFLEFDVCFYRSQNYFDVRRRGSD